MEAVLANSKVVANRDFSGADRQDLARVFIKAFDSRGSPFPIDFEDVWQFLDYSTKGNALQKLKRCFQEGIDFAFFKGHVMKDQSTGQITGKQPDSYQLTENAFEHFAMSAPGSKGHQVRGFFLAVRNAWLELQAPPPVTEPLPAIEPTPMMLYNLEMERVRQAGQKLDEDAPGKRMQFAVDWRTTLSSIGAYTVTDQMTFQAIVRTAQEVGPLRALEPPTMKEYTLSEFLQHEHGKIVNWKHLMKPGKALVALFREVSGGEDPGSKLQEVNGRQTPVKAYTDLHIPNAEPGTTGFSLMDQIARRFGFL
jgi:phage anti-repressor protein